MRIPQLVAAFLAVRQAEPLLPSTYCSPECPSCKTDIAAFEVNVSCVANSTFITNCGTCQQCIITYAIEEGATDDTNQLENDMINILNLCDNSSASMQIEALQSQASKLSVIGVYLSSASSAEAASKMTITSSSGATITGSASTAAHPDDSWTSWATKTWTDGSYYASRTSSPTSSSNSTALANTTPTLIIPSYPATVIPSYPAIAASATPTPVPTPSSTWIAGPVIGSILGMSTVFIVIFFTRRKYSRSRTFTPPKDINDTDSNRSSTQTQVLQISIPREELAVNEVHEMPALEPVGSELTTPKDTMPADETGEGREGWPLPVGPLPAMFAMSELRDQRVVRALPKHDTFYHA